MIINLFSSLKQYVISGQTDAPKLTLLAQVTIPYVHRMAFYAHPLNHTF